MGDVTKIFAVYKDPWWRKNGYTGIILNTEKEELFQVSFDNSDVDAKKGVLFAFCIGNKSKIYQSLTPEERQKKVLDAFARCLGKQAYDIEGFYDHTFTNDPFTMGCYAGMMGLNSWSNFGEAVRKPVGNIHWAGKWWFLID